MKSGFLLKPSVLLGLALWLSCLSLGYAQIMFPQDTSPLDVIATNGAGTERHLSSINGIVPMVMVRPNQTVPVTLQFPTDKAGTPVAVAALDGGGISSAVNAMVLPTGRMLFTFSPGAMAGRYRVLVQVPGAEYLLTFYVVDPNNPPSQKRPRGVQ